MQVCTRNINSTDWKNTSIMKYFMQFQGKLDERLKRMEVYTFHYIEYGNTWLKEVWSSSL